MSEIISFFSDVPVIFRTIILLGGIVFFWILEGIIPFYSLNYKKKNHAILNLLFTITTAIIGFGFAFVLLKSTEIASSTRNPTFLYAESLRPKEIETQLLSQILQKVSLLNKTLCQILILHSQKAQTHIHKQNFFRNQDWTLLRLTELASRLNQKPVIKQKKQLVENIPLNTQSNKAPFGNNNLILI